MTRMRLSLSSARRGRRRRRPRRCRRCPLRCRSVPCRARAPPDGAVRAKTAVSSPAIFAVPSSFARPHLFRAPIRSTGVGATYVHSFIRESPPPERSLACEAPLCKKIRLSPTLRKRKLISFLKVFRGLELVLKWD